MSKIYRFGNIGTEIDDDEYIPLLEQRWHDEYTKMIKETPPTAEFINGFFETQIDEINKDLDLLELLNKNNIYDNALSIKLLSKNSCIIYQLNLFAENYPELLHEKYQNQIKSR